MDWAITVTSTCSFEISYVRHNPYSGHTLVVGKGRGTIDFGEIYTWDGPEPCGPADEAFLFFVMLDTERRRGLWQTTMRSRDNNGFVHIENACLAANDSMLFSIAWEGDLMLPSGRVERAGDARAGLLLRWGPARGDL